MQLLSNLLENLMFRLMLNTFPCHFLLHVQTAFETDRKCVFAFFFILTFMTIFDSIHKLPDSQIKIRAEVKKGLAKSLELQMINRIEYATRCVLLERTFSLSLIFISSQNFHLTHAHTNHSQFCCLMSNHHLQPGTFTLSLIFEEKKVWKMLNEWQ